MQKLLRNLLIFRKPPAKRVVQKRLLPLNRNSPCGIMKAGLANRKQKTKEEVNHEN